MSKASAEQLLTIARQFPDGFFRVEAMDALGLPQTNSGDVKYYQTCLLYTSPSPRDS